MSHTPGPWEVVMPGEVDEHYAVMDGFGHTASVYGYPDNAAEAWANARLIAAAPEMLDALKSIERKWRRGDGAFSVGELCRQVIAKAEGRSE